MSEVLRRFAYEAQVPYAHTLERVDFVGDRGSFTLVPESALDLEDWADG